MSSNRVDPFANVNMSQFKPKAENEVQAKAKPEDIEKISKDNGFPSREAQSAPVAEPLKRGRFSAKPPRVQLNIKVEAECHERFYRMAEERGVRLGDLLSRALDALEKSR